AGVARRGGDTAAGIVHRRRPALDRSLYPGVFDAPDRAGTHSADPDRPHLSSGVSSPLVPARVRDPADFGSLSPSAGRSDDAAGHWGPHPAHGDRAAGRDE